MSVGLVSVSGAGLSQGDPIIYGLPLTFVFGAATADIAGNVAAGIDVAQGFPIVKPVTSGLVPGSTVFQPAGLAGTYTSSTRVLGVASAGVAAVGMHIGLSWGATETYARIIAISGNNLTLERDVFGQDATNVAYQIFYTYKTFAGSENIPSDGLGKVNYVKFQAADALGNLAQNTPGLPIWCIDIPTNAILINGGSAIGQRIAVTNPSFQFLSDLASMGGAVTFELVNAVGLTWFDDTVVEKNKSVLFHATRPPTERLKVQGTDGAKSATLRIRAVEGSPRFFDIANISFIYDATPPSLIVSVISGE